MLTTASSSSGQLCSICNAIDFKHLIQTCEGGFDLGHVRDIFKKTDCAFCRLVTASLRPRWDEGGYVRNKNDYKIDTDFVGRVQLTATGPTTSPKDRECAFRLTVPLPVQPLGAGPDQPLIGYIYVSSEDIERLRLKSRFNGRIVKELVDPTLIRTWLDNCDGLHQSTCLLDSQIENRLPESFRVIDVVEGKLTRAPFGCRYLALSYVWGRTQPVQTLESNIDDFGKIGALFSYIKLPETIATAIKLASDISERYLWVDSLCIVQDRVAEKHDQINRMDAIYRGAYATIVAAAGVNANSGLPGIGSITRSVTQLSETVQKMSLVAQSPKLSYVLNRSTWYTRAWTYQEQLLSPRRVYLASSEAFFECQEDLLCESYEGPIRDNYLSDPLQMVHITTGNDAYPSYYTPDSIETFNAFCLAVGQYTERNLSYPLDILNAFTGVAALWTAAFGWTFTQGLPQELLYWGLLWQPTSVIHRRCILSNGGPTFPFSSWSWAGWTGPVVHKHLSTSNRFRSEVSSFKVVKAIPDRLEFKTTAATFHASSTEGIVYESNLDPNDTEFYFTLYDAQGHQCGIAAGFEPSFAASTSSTTPVPFTCLLLSRYRDTEGGSMSQYARRCKKVQVHAKEDFFKWVTMKPGDMAWSQRMTDGQFDDKAFETRLWCLMDVMLVVKEGKYWRRIALGIVHEDAWNAAQPTPEEVRVI